MKQAVWRAAIEVAFIIFLYYSNLLMGEFNHSGKGQEMGLAWAIQDIVTPANFAIAIVAALIGYGVFEFLRSKFQAYRKRRADVQSGQGDSRMRILCGLGIAVAVCGSLAAQSHEGAPSRHDGGESHGARWSGARSSMRFSGAGAVVTVPFVYPVVDPDNAPAYGDGYQAAPAEAYVGDRSGPQYPAAADAPPHGFILNLEATSETAPAEPPHYYVALKDHHIYLAVAYWVEKDTLHYFLPGNAHNQVSLALVDYDLTQRLNRESGTEVTLPGAK